MREAGGTSRVLARRRPVAGHAGADRPAVAAEHADGVLTINATAGWRGPGRARGRARERQASATFDLGPDVLKAVEAGRIAFAVDQQPYLQGYLPIVMLAQRARYGLFPAQGDVVATGPHFVTRGQRRAGARAQPALDPLTARGCRADRLLHESARPRRKSAPPAGVGGRRRTE